MFKVTAFATISGRWLLHHSKIIHVNVPKEKNEYMNKEISLVFLVRIIFKSCRKKEDVVNIAY